MFALLPRWAHTEKLACTTYNARSETVDSKPSFKAAWAAERPCLIPARAFYGLNCESGRAKRWRKHPADGLPFCLARIWNE